ncbi:hypothetical protein F4604DRAFT_186142 [Suillus subluteus]|nr:hypothetical protein F4604DRAFT_186142 [Suillus subluteus]
MTQPHQPHPPTTAEVTINTTQVGEDADNAPTALMTTTHDNSSPGSSSGEAESLEPDLGDDLPELEVHAHTARSHLPSSSPFDASDDTAGEQPTSTPDRHGGEDSHYSNGAEPRESGIHNPPPLIFNSPHPPSNTPPPVRPRAPPPVRPRAPPPVHLPAPPPVHLPAPPPVHPRDAVEFGPHVSHLVPQSWVVRNVLFPLVGISSQDHVQCAIATDDETNWRKLRADIREVISDVYDFSKFMIIVSALWLGYLFKPSTPLVLLFDWQTPAPYVFFSLCFSVAAVTLSSRWRQVLVTFPVTSLQRYCKRLVTYISFFFGLALPTLFILGAIACLVLGVVVGVLLLDIPVFTIITIVCCVVLLFVCLLLMYWL